MIEFSNTLVSSLEETLACGRELGRRLEPLSVIALDGTLGAGKTHFTKGIAKGVGFAGEVTSPTFSLVHEYRGGRLPLFHFDFYRLESEEQVIDIGWDEFLDEPGVVVVEWSERFPRIFPEETLWLKMEAQSDETRSISQSTNKDSSCSG